MKLFIVLSVIACSYGAKLDRTYLPPESASTAGGSPGSLSAPTGPGGFGPAPSRGAGAPGFQPLSPAGPSAFGKPTGPSTFGQSSGPAAFGQSGSSGFGQSGSAGPSGAGNYGQAASGFGQQSTGFNQGGSFNQGAQGDFAGQGFQQPQRAQASADQSATILRYENQNDGETFSYAFETSNGISAEESGVATNGVQAQGGYSYTGDDGQNYRVTYTADENGYQPQGDHLPTPPPIPEEILRSIEKNAAAAAAGNQEGAYNPLEDESVSGQQYSANGGYSGGPASFNQAQGGRPTQQGPSGQAAVYNQQSGSGVEAYNQQGGAFNQQGGSTGFPSNRPSAQSQGAAGQYNQNQGSSGQFNQAAQGSAGQNRAQNRGSQTQGDNGYEYNRPQANAQFVSSAQSTTGQFNRPSPQGSSFNRPAAPSRPSQGPSGSFPRPSGPAGPTQGSFAPQTYNQPAAQPRPQTYNQGGQTTGSAFTRPSGPSGLAGRPQYNQAAQSGSQGPAGSFPRPSGPSQGSFGQQAGGRTQGSAEGYQYNRPGQQGSQSAQGSQSTFGQGPQSSFGQGPQRQGTAQAPQRSQGTQGRGQTFEGPKQPASFNEQDGYKY